MGVETVIRSFPAKLRERLESLEISHLEEVRLRAGQPLMVVWNGKEYFVTDQGQMSTDQHQSWKVSEDLLRETVESFSRHSLYAYEGGSGAGNDQDYEVSVLFKCPDRPRDPWLRRWDPSIFI